jgi:serine/threonine-protein kinase
MTALPCPPEYWPRFSALLDQALDMPETERTTWLHGLGGEDAAIRPWVQRVLGGSASGPDRSFMEQSCAGLESAGFAIGDVVGPYRLEGKLGQGGMGEVWRASRADDGPRREVALKLPHADLLAGPFRQRFVRERDVLAALTHPHIAGLYDAGFSEEGHPFLALELVEGVPITDFCRAKALGLDQRIDLVRQVLAALSYAHQRLIVHRDIKPSNVLVTREGSAKLLDFGIAKLLQPGGGAPETKDLLLTQPAARLATPAYAAPEQFADGPITVATDLFSVGVLLYELCTGGRPFATVAAITDTATIPLASQRADAAAAGLADGKKLAQRLRGDLDAVIAKALAVAPADRYSSAEAFERDLARCRQGLPVAARRITWAARSVKFARRNRIGVALAGVLAVSVIGGTAGVAWQAARAAREAAHARKEAARATAIKNFVLGLFRQVDPRTGAVVMTMTAKQVLDTGADQADAAFAKQPDTEMELLGSLGTIYESIPDPKRSAKVRLRRLELARGLYGADDPRVVQDTIELSATLSLSKDVAGAAALLETIRVPVLSRFGPASYQRAEWLMAHAYTVRAQRHGAAQAEMDDQAAIDIVEAHVPGSDIYPHALEDLAGNEEEREEFSAAVANYKKMRAALIAAHQFDAIEGMQWNNDIAFALEIGGQTQDADAAYQTAQDQAEHLAGKDSPFYRFALMHHAELLHMRGDRAQAHSLFAKAEAAIIGRPSPSGYQGHGTLNRLYGGALLREGRAAEAIPRLEDALAGSRVRAPYLSRLYRDEQTLGEAYAAVGRAADARKLLSAARAGWIDEDGPTSTVALAARQRWARFLLSQGDSAGAATELNGILAVANGTPSAPAALAAADLADLASARGDAAQANALSARALQWIDAVTVEYDARDRIDVWLARAGALLAGGKPAEAHGWAQKAVSAAVAYDAELSPQRARAEALLRQLQ